MTLLLYLYTQLNLSIKLCQDNNESWIDSGKCCFNITLEATFIKADAADSLVAFTTNLTIIVSGFTPGHCYSQMLWDSPELFMVRDRDRL